MIDSTTSKDGRTRRVAICTWFAYRNYGTALQAVALNKCIASMGYDVRDVNYDPVAAKGAHGGEGRRSLGKRLNGKIKQILGYAPLVTEERERRFQSFIDENLPLTAPVASQSDFDALNESFDCFVCGSDQVWSPRGSFDPRYFLDFVTDNSKKIAYAPSFGCDSLDGYDTAGRISELLRLFPSIGVREASGARIVEACSGRKPQVVVDPTLLLPREDWSRLARPRHPAGRPYCLFYFLGDWEGNRRAARKIARYRNLPVIEIPVFQRDLRHAGTPSEAIGPAEFLWLVENADLVCTDSFHGMVFANIFTADFVAFERFDPSSPGSQNTRIYSFLEMLGAQSRLLRRSGMRDWRSLADQHVDYDSIRPRITTRRDTSIAFLKDALEKSTSGASRDMRDR